MKLETAAHARATPSRLRFRRRQASCSSDLFVDFLSMIDFFVFAAS
jgi:hypothetical protein